MRYLITITSLIFLTFGCGSSYDDTIIEKDIEIESTEEIVEDNTEIVPIRNTMCFKIDPILTDQYSYFVESLEATVESWGWKLDQDREDCESTIIVGDLILEDSEERYAMAMLRRESASDCFLGEAFEGYYSQIIFDRRAVESWTIVDTIPAGCAASKPNCIPLGQVLRHELGHLLEVPHTGSKQSPMYPKAQHAKDYMPRDIDLDRSIKPDEFVHIIIERNKTNEDSVECERVWWAK